MPISLKADDGKESDVEVSIGADLVSNYIWRGQDLGGVSIQPTLAISYKGFSLGSWGSIGFDQTDNKEIDLTLGYENSGFNIGITDYWISGNETFFHFKAKQTAHVFEGNIGYDFGVVALSWNTNFAGADYCKKDGTRAYSSYFQVDVPFSLGGVDWSAELGATPYEGAYASSFAIVNVSLGASKTLDITKSFSLPLFAKLTANPSTESLYFAFGLSF
ncbi:MAG: hypothetical protein Q4F97_07740 [Bacteroidales bacterium]|nr:hypothetical protein [Bacteroidales bacterium]